MLLTEQTAVPGAALPLQEFKDHLRLGTGFADDTVQDLLAESYLRAAMSTIEGRTGKAMIARDFLLRLNYWRDDLSQSLPMAPVSAITALTLRDAAGLATVIGTDRYRLVPDLHRPKIAGRGTGLPGIPADGSAEITFTAGFGLGWNDVPGDLAQAVFLLAADFHENRHEGSSLRTALPPVVRGLIARWRTVRVLGGGET